MMKRFQENYTEYNVDIPEVALQVVLQIRVCRKKLNLQIQLTLLEKWLPFLR